MFVSELFTGSISDRALFEHSGILELLDLVPCGKSIMIDCVMADCGFEVQDLLVKSGLLSNAPPLKGSKCSFSEEEVKKTQKIAHLHSHAEWAIGQVKNRFCVLQDTIRMSWAGSINQIWSVYAVSWQIYSALYWLILILVDNLRYVCQDFFQQCPAIRLCFFLMLTSIKSYERLRLCKKLT